MTNTNLLRKKPSNRLAERTRSLAMVVAAFIAVITTVNLRAAEFSSPQDISGGSVTGVTSIQLGDLNEDGLQDIAVFEGGKHANGRKAFAWFEAPNWKRHEFNTSYSPGPFIGDTAIVDIDGDGHLDIVVPEDPHSGSGTGSLYWYKNPGNGATGSWSRYAIGSWSNAIHIGEIDVADIDGDGRQDVVIRHLGESSIRICFQNGDGSWTTRRLSVRDREGLMVADIDRDGRPDIVLNGFWWATPSNARTGDFKEYVIDSAFYSQSQSGLNNSVKAAFGDIDGDGRKDVVMVPAEGAAIYLAWYKAPNDPKSQSWQKYVIENNWGNMHQVELGDIDNDGDLDIMGGLSFGDSGIYIWYNDGNGSFSRTTVTSSYGLYYGVLGDIGNDGDLDIVGPDTYSFSSKPLLYENVASSSIAPPQAFDAVESDGEGIGLTWTKSSSYSTEVERKVGTGNFSRIATVNPGIGSYFDSSVESDNYYTYRIRFVDSELASAFTSSSSIPFGVEPSELQFTYTDVGSVGASGAFSENANGFTLSASGSDIWSSSDEFGFAYLEVEGDGWFEARVASRTGSDQWEKAGVMVRASLSATSRHALMQVSGSNGSIFDYRKSDGASTDKVQPNDGADDPYWVRIERSGNTLSGYTSSDGSNWNLIGDVSVDLGSTAYWGLAVTSHDDGKLTTVEFDSVSISHGDVISDPTPVANSDAYSLEEGETLSVGSPGVLANDDTAGGVAELVSQAANGSVALSSNGSFTYTPNANFVGDDSFTYRVVAGSESSATVAVSLSVEDFVAPAPGSVTSSYAGDGVVTLSWNKPNVGESGFEILRSVNSGSATAIAEVGPGVNSFSDEGLEPGIYGYSVVTQHDLGDSTPSAVTEVEVPDEQPVIVAPESVAIEVTGETEITLSWIDPNETSYPAVIERSVDGSAFEVVGEVPAGVTEFVDQALDTGKSYLYRVRFETDPSGPYSEQVSVYLEVSGGTLSLQYADIGSVGASGSLSFDGSVYTLSASGRDIWYGSDEFGFAYVAADGDGWLQARVLSRTGGDQWEKAGVMVRAALTASSRHALMQISGGNGSMFDYRLSDGSSTDKYQPNDGASEPYWVRIERSGDTLSGYRSSDGSSWSLVGEVSVSLGSTAYWGLAVTSHNDGQLTTVKFDSVSSSFGSAGGGDPDPDPVPVAYADYYELGEGETLSIGAPGVLGNDDAAGGVAELVSGPSNGSVSLGPDGSFSYSPAAGFSGEDTFDYCISAPGGESPIVTVEIQVEDYIVAAPDSVSANFEGDGVVSVSWSGPNDGESGYELYRASASGSFASIGQLSASTTSYVDSGLDAGIYRYSVVALHDLGDSERSEEAQVEVPEEQQVVLVAPESLEIAVTGETEVTLTWLDPNDPELPAFIERSIDGSSYQGIGEVPAGVTEFVDGDLTPGASYLYRVRADDDSSSLYSEEVEVNLEVSGEGFSPQYADIGSVGASGSLSFDGSVYTLSASGRDIWYGSDEFGFAYVAADGDGWLQARVLSRTGGDQWEKAGVMVRAALTASSRHALMQISGGNGSMFDYRLSDGSSTDKYQPNDGASEPYWVRIERSGDTLSGYRSSDGSSWSLVGEVSVSLGSTAYWGLAVTSHNDGQLTTVKFDSVSSSFGSAGGGDPDPDPVPVAYADYYELGEGETLSIGAPGVLGNDDAAGGVAELVSGPSNGSVSLDPDGSFSYSPDAGFSGEDTFTYRIAATGGVSEGIVYLLVNQYDLQAPVNFTGSVVNDDSVYLEWQDNNSQIDGFVIERAVNGGSYSTLVELASSERNYVDEGLSGGSEYSYRINAAYNAERSISETELHFWISSEAVVWTNLDIGKVAVAGDTFEDGAEVAVFGSGADIWGRKDEFHFAYQTLQGDGEMVARVTDRDGGDDWAKVGLMVRNSLSESSAHAYMEVTRDYGSIFDFRKSNGGFTDKTASGDSLDPVCWLRIVRSGDTLTGYVADGSSYPSSWRKVGSVEVSLNDQAYWGLAVTAHKDGAVASGVFDSIELTDL